METELIQVNSRSRVRVLPGSQNATKSIDCEMKSLLPFDCSKSAEKNVINQNCEVL